MAIILFVTYLSLILGFGIIAAWDLSRLKKEIQSDLELNAKLVGDYCIVPLTFEDKQQATEVLSRLKNISFIEIGCLYDKDGNLFATYPDTLNKNSFLVLPDKQNTVLKDEAFYIHETILFKNEMYGTIFIKANPKPLSDVTRAFAITLSVITLVLIFLSFILAQWMQKYISSPIVDLKKHFDRVGKNQDFTAHIFKQNNDEIGSLYDGFNELLIELKKKEEQFRTLVENIPGSTYRCLLDESWTMLYISNEIQNLTGYPKSDFIGENPEKTFASLMHPDDIQPIWENTNKAVSEKLPYVNEYRIIDKSGSIHFVYAKGQATFDKEGNPLYLDGTIFDITERKKAEEELKKHRDNMEQLVKERTIELEKKNKELEEMNKAFVGREFRIKELREKMKDLEQKLK